MPGTGSPHPNPLPEGEGAKREADFTKVELYYSPSLWERAGVRASRP
jgi:hypothetical protein